MGLRSQHPKEVFFLDAQQLNCLLEPCSSEIDELNKAGVTYGETGRIPEEAVRVVSLSP